MTAKIKKAVGSTQKAKTKQTSVKSKQRKSERRALNIVKRRAVVAGMLLSGRNYREIAQEVGAKSTESVFTDVQAIIAEWKETQKHNISEWITLELERIGRLESEAWDAWERSCKDAEIHSEEDGPLGHKTKHVLKGQSGNPAFLDVVLKCVTRRCELLGLDEPTEVNVPGLLSPDEIEKLRQTRWQKVMPALQVALVERLPRGYESVSNA